MDQRERPRSGPSRGTPINSKRSRSLGWRILVSMAVIALGPLIIMAYQGYHCARQAIVDSQSTHLVSVLESRGSRIVSWLNEIKSNISFMTAIYSTLPSTSSEAIHPGGHISPDWNPLESLKQQDCCFESIVIYDQSWNPLIHSSLDDKQDSDLLQDVFKSKVNNTKGFAVSEPWLGDNGELFIKLGLKAPDQSPIGPSYIVSRLNLATRVQSILADRTGLGKTGKVYLLTPDARYLDVTQGPRDLIGLKCTIPPAVLQRAVGDYTGQIVADGESSEVFEYSDFQGKDVLGTSKSIPDLDWILVAEIDRDEAFGWLSILRSRALITGAFTLVLILILAVAFSNRLSKPLKRLANIAHRIADGHHGDRLEPLEGEEAQEVGLAFNMMLDELAASHARLQHAAALAAVGELSTSIVHEMRNPLSSVKMNLQALRRSVESDSAYLELAEIALDQAARLEKMLTDLLNYGKPISLDVVEVNFSDLADDVVEVARKESEAKSVSIKIENSLKEATLNADHEQLWRSLTNLVSNAVRAAPQDGTVTISAGLSIEDPERVTLSVRDNGPGVDETLKETIFQPFYTIHEGGTGLGLANVKKIAEYHGGKVSVDNAEDGGAVFTLELPMKGPPV